MMVTLEINRTRLRLVAVDSAAGYTGNFLVIDRGHAVEDHGYPAADEGYVVGLPIRAPVRSRPLKIAMNPSLSGWGALRGASRTMLPG